VYGGEPLRLGNSAVPVPRDSAQEKLDRLVENGSKSPVPRGTTTFNEHEVNQLLRAHSAELLPHGLSDPHLRFIGSDALVATVVVDLDEYKRRRRGPGGLDPLVLLSGRLPVTGRGTLHAQSGQGRFKLHAADINGIPLPPALVREMIAALSRSEHNPEGYDIEQSFALAAGIKSITIESNQATVTQ
jgi:hypothetical protein